ncbi:MAG: Ig-like domain-containing protein [Nanoarchaeota archaeon]|nr:Ig-like domain-containing protein [Nanoarchaeota archaeon]
MNYSKLLVVLLLSLTFVLFVVAEELAPEVINENTSIAPEQNSTLEILPVEETTVVIQPIEEVVPVENSSDTLTGSLVIEPVVEQPILKTIMELIMNKISVIRGQLVQLTASLFYGDGSPAMNKEVTFYAGEEKIGSDTTNGAGKAKLSWDTSPFGANVYVISAEYAGETGVEGSSAGANVVITEVLPKVQETTTNESMLTTAAVVEPAVTAPVEKIESCVTVNFEDTENVYGTCTHEVLECGGLNNATCATVQKEYRCFLGQQKVQKSYQQCKTVGWQINNGQKIVKLDTTNYACSTQESGSTITVICDSQYDGNGDGICKSGESCQKFVVNGTTIVRSEKNSDDQYKEADDSYFMPEVGVVVLQ